MQKYFPLVLGLVATVATSNAAITFNLSVIPTMAGSGNVTVSPGQSGGPTTVDFTFAAAPQPVFSPNGVAPTGSTWANTSFKLETDSDGWPPNENSYAIIKLGTLTLPSGEPGSNPTCSPATCNITASLKVTIGGVQYTLTTPNSPVAINGNSSVTVTPDGTARDASINTGQPSPENHPKFPRNIDVPGGTLKIWLYTSQDTGSWSPFTLNSSDRTQDVWMKVWLTPTPEPGSMVLMGGGLLALGLIARRVRQKQSETLVN